VTDLIADEEPFSVFVDRALGTAVEIFDHSYGDYETAGLLEVSELSYEEIDQQGWHNVGYYPHRGVLRVAPALLGFFTDSRRQAIHQVLEMIHAGDDLQIETFVVTPRLVGRDWRSQRRGPGGGDTVLETDQLALMPADQKPELRVRSKAEFSVYNGFRQARSGLPSHASLAITVNCPLQLPGGRIPEVDVLVIYNGRATVIEIDDDTHRRGNRYMADATRDQGLRDCGIHVERVAAEDTNDPREVEALVRKVLDRLGDRRLALGR
jgi:hypothetical protein